MVPTISEVVRWEEYLKQKYKSYIGTAADGEKKSRLHWTTNVNAVHSNLDQMNILNLKKWTEINFKSF